ncbi:MAG: hypothetical protein ACOX51_01135 [Myxococcota bacterium]|jgi:hypothetical protein|nr:hypothetical protein [Myxococcota bacterium]MBP8970806.1 hypothetical protein [Myxococcota bacterium]HHW97907.1 hypothetical protein [Oligoflexales bacterium]HQC45508.1 hypothetical protein [Myxococcota bacterium]HQL57714.1 hypothetical protein [Myxococcota bacterium]
MEGVSGFSGLTMTVLAYAAIWVILLVFVVRAFFMLSGIRRELDELKETLAEGMASHGSDAEKLPKS